MMTNLMTILERKAFISSNPRIVLSSCPPPCGHFSIQESASGGLSYNAKIVHVRTVRVRTVRARTNYKGHVSECQSCFFNIRFAICSRSVFCVIGNYSVIFLLHKKIPEAKFPLLLASLFISNKSSTPFHPQAGLPSDNSQSG